MALVSVTCQFFKRPVKLQVSSTQELCGEGWRPHMGGALELFSCDEAGPAQVALRAFPANNTLAFFAVGPKSFHQVGCDLYTNTVGIDARKGGGV